MSIPVEIEFEAALIELERIVEALERGGPDLSEALAGYGRGVALLGHCQGILDQAERSVALLTGVDDSGEPITAPFDAAATATPGPTVTVEAVSVLIAVPPAPAQVPAASSPSAVKKSKPISTPTPSPTTPEAPF